MCYWAVIKGLCILGTLDNLEIAERFLRKAMKGSVELTPLTFDKISAGYRMIGMGKDAERVEEFKQTYQHLVEDSGDDDL